MEQFVEFLVLSLVQNKEAVKITSKTENDECTILVQTDQQDFGRVVGKNGRNAQAIRTLVNSFAKQKEDNKKYTIRFE